MKLTAAKLSSLRRVVVTAPAPEQKKARSINRTLASRFF
jgi:hypothetical protein